MAPHRNHAFTLIELLIVVAIIAILAAIAVPNFLESQTRAKSTRAKSDIRAVCVALEAFRVDNSRYPRCGVDFDGNVGLAEVTSPIAYIVGQNVKDIYHGKLGTGLLSDAYGYASRDKDGFAFSSGTNNGQFYFVSSNGPDTKLDNYWDALNADNTAGFIETIYDPSNGTISPGNIYRSGGQPMGNGTDAARFVNQYAPSSTSSK